ncbi:hypothetical protein [Anianabacter salinae]|uniref:hypothetical protein n=1 Tax=Anianabacter salinae TaxID=2851023 RepID=UPI00225E5507|nr:hypothetical protein [Anianabacter salinae]MBV0910840.1 hypothetical protein [Anianabacter salinae]
MSDRMTIGPRDHGLVRVFALDIDTADLATWQPPEDGRDWPLKDALGAAHLDPAKVEVFPASTLDGLGLSRYLIDGAGVAPSEIGADAARLDGITGVIVVIPSSALGSGDQTLTIIAPLRHVGTYREEDSPVAFAPLPAGSSEGLITGAPKSVPAPGRAPRGSLIVVAAIALVALIAVAFSLASGR